MNAELQAARQRVLELEAEEQDDERRRLITQLASIREERTICEARREVLVDAMNREKAARDSTWSKVQAQETRISEHLQRRPAIFAFLPDDPECVRWRERMEALEFDLTTLRSAHDLLPDPERNRMELVQLAGSMGRLFHLELAENNLIAALEGKSGKAFVPHGGISAVG